MRPCCGDDDDYSKGGQRRLSISDRLRQFLQQHPALSACIVALLAIYYDIRRERTLKLDKLGEKLSHDTGLRKILEQILPSPINDLVRRPYAELDKTPDRDKSMVWAKFLAELSPDWRKAFKHIVQLYESCQHDIWLRIPSDQQQEEWKRMVDSDAELTRLLSCPKFYVQLSKSTIHLPAASRRERVLSMSSKAGLLSVMCPNVQKVPTA